MRRSMLHDRDPYTGERLEPEHDPEIPSWRHDEWHREDDDEKEARRISEFILDGYPENFDPDLYRDDPDYNDMKI